MMGKANGKGCKKGKGYKSGRSKSGMRRRRK